LFRQNSNIDKLEQLFVLIKAPIYCIAFVLLLSCGSEVELESLKKENAELKTQNAESDSIMNQILDAYNDIDSTTRLIQEKKAFINNMAKKSHLTKSDKELVLAEMDTINMLLDMNRSKVSDLEENLENVSSGAKAADIVLQSMNEKNTYADDEVVDMKKDLAQISKDFSELFEEYVYKEAENMEMKEQLTSAAEKLELAQGKLDEAQEKLESAWYVVGTKDELKAKGIVYKKGFFDNNSVNEDFDHSQFKKVNIYEFKEIILNVKKINVVTTHPSEAYESVGIKKKVSKFVITNPDQFWSVSKALVIEIED
jgi:chromosome segregation ATPase